MRIAFLIITLFFFSSCLLIEPIGQGFFTLNEDFELRLFEAIEPGGSQFKLIVKTAEPQPCENSEIELSSQIDQTGIILRLENILEPDESQCIRSEAYISNEIPIPLFFGSMNLSVQIQDIIDHRGQLSIDSSNAFFILNDQEGLNITKNFLHRMPEKMVWGSISIDAEGNKAQWEEMIQAIEAACENAQLDPGYYSYFDVSSAGDVKFLDVPSALYRYDFAMRYNGDPQDLYTALEAFRIPEITSIIRASDGSRF